MTEIKKSITFFYTDAAEKQTVEPLVNEANKRGYKVKLTSNILEKAEIGVYCQHSCFPENSKFSIIMLHDLGQGHPRWPNMWILEPWDKFDIGILPGKTWSQRWQLCSAHPYTRPRIGVFELGWPKADILFKDGKLNQPETQNQEALTLKERLNLPHPHTILYAPSWENDGKQDEFVQSLKELPVNLLLKQAHYSEYFAEIKNNIKKMNELHSNYKENVHIINPDINIMLCLELADIIVSDESNVLFEGLLLNVPGIAVTDWTIPDCSPPRLANACYEFVIKTKKANLSNTVEKVLNSLESYKKQLEIEKNNYFSYLGVSSARIMDLIDSYVSHQSFEIEPVQSTHKIQKVPLKFQLKRYWYEKTMKLKMKFPVMGRTKRWLYRQKSKLIPKE